MSLGVGVLPKLSQQTEKKERRGKRPKKYQIDTVFAFEKPTLETTNPIIKGGRRFFIFFFEPTDKLN